MLGYHAMIPMFWTTPTYAQWTHEIENAKTESVWIYIYIHMQLYLWTNLFENDFPISLHFLWFAIATFDYPRVYLQAGAPPVVDLQTIPIDLP